MRVSLHTEAHTNLCDENAVASEPGFHRVLIERFGVELIARASLNGVGEVTYDHIEALLLAF